MIVDIWLINNVIAQRNEDLGIDSDKTEYSLAKLNFVDHRLDGYWRVYDEEIDSDVLVFYINGEQYRTPYDELIELKFKDIINQNNRYDKKK